ncbi:hypothetical protein ACIPC1_24850 [Streptomyces sp. NPDC087263]|uniref:hypothetical protein n=1 Tax=Streptomyces sp. NPDC087263 TaxID=3365773 RepID=UPI0038305E5D
MGGRGGRRGGPASLPEPVLDAVALCAVAVLGVIAFRLIRAVRVPYATRRVLNRLGEGHPPDSELATAASSTPRAFAIPGGPGRILVTSATLGALEPAEHRALPAHERARLAHRPSPIATRLWRPPSP